MRIGSSRAFLLTLLLSCASCSGGSGPGESGERAAAKKPGAAAETAAAGVDVPNVDGPGLRATTIASLKLPVIRTVDLSHVQSRHFAAALGKDPIRIFEFVRDEVAFEPYVGCLRGPRGTLMAMAGNSVDRASLLGSMLANSGHRVRFARGTLKEDVAQDLVSSIWARRAAGTTDAADDSSPESEGDFNRLMKSIESNSALLAEALGKAGHPDKREPALSRATLINETRDHYWIEWWHEDKWIALDPSFASAQPGQAYAEPESTFDVLPDELFHQVQVRVRVEEVTGDVRSSRELLSHAARAADLSGADLALSHQAAQESEGSQVRPVLLVQQEQIIGLPFWLIVPRGNPAGGMVDALGGGGGLDESTPTAAALFVDIEFVAPGGRRESIVREIFDRIGKQRRASGEPVNVDALGAGTDIADWLPGAIYDFYVTTGAVHASHLDGVVDVSPRPEGDDEDVGAELRMIAIAHATMSDSLLGRVADSAGPIMRVYANTPRISVAEISVRDGKPRVSLDLRQDRPRVAVSGFRRDELFIAEVLRGVVSGNLEREVIDFFVRGDGEQPTARTDIMSTSLAFERARESGVKPVLLSSDSAALSSDVPKDVRARIDASLSEGQLVVVPRGAVEISGARRLAWWQVDPITGATTAVTDEGLHQATAEGVVVRTTNGTYVIRIQHGSRMYRATTRSASQAARHVRNATRNFEKNGVQTQWRGVVELWDDILGLGI